MQQTFDKLYEAWLEDYHSNFETQFEDSIVKRYCFWHGGTQEGVEGKGKTFNAAYEILIYAFFLGLYSGQGRRPLVGKKRNLSMEMKHWGNINTKLFKERKKYDQIQKYIFAALIAICATSSTPSSFNAEISTTGHDSCLDNSSLLILSPNFLTTSIILRAITIGMPSSAN